MSRRYTLKSDRHDIPIVWDDQMQSFYAIVKDPNISEDKNPEITWIGNGYNSIEFAKRLQELANAHGAVISEDIANQLESDSSDSL